MSELSAFERLKNFLETKPASQKAVKHLRNGVEIGLVIGHQIECAYFHENGIPKLEKRPAKNPDVIFFIKPETVDILTEHPGEDVGDFGISVLKEYLAGGVRIKAPGNILGLTMNGYLGIMKEGGPTFGKFLASKGVTGLSKAFSAIKNLRD